METVGGYRRKWQSDCKTWKLKLTLILHQKTIPKNLLRRDKSLVNILSNDVVLTITLGFIALVCCILTVTTLTVAGTVAVAVALTLPHSDSTSGYWSESMSGSWADSFSSNNDSNSSYSSSNSNYSDTSSSSNHSYTSSSSTTPSSNSQSTSGSTLSTSSSTVPPSSSEMLSSSNPTTLSSSSEILASNSSGTTSSSVLDTCTTACIKNEACNVTESGVCVTGVCKNHANTLYCKT